MKVKTIKTGVALARAAMICSLATPIAANAAKLVTVGTTALFSGVEKSSGETYEVGNAAATSNLVVTVESEVGSLSFAGRDELAALDGGDYIGAIAASTNESGTVVWMASDGSGWVVLSGPAPETNTAYTVKTELDLGAKKLRHSVKGSGDDAYATLGDWLPANADNTVLSSILVYDDVTLSGTCPNATDIAVAGAGSIAFYPNELKAIGMDTDGKTYEQIASSLADDGLNGIAKWQNYVLGISTTDPNAKPYAAPVQNADPAKLTFSLGGVDVNASSGATVKYAVGEVDSPSSDFAPSSWTNPDEAIQLEVPSGVKYYRMKVKIETP